MLEVVFPPSPNWYLPSVLCVAPDGCIVYGSCANFITILTPNGDPLHRTFSIKIIHVAHKLRVTCIALCPGWLTTRNFVSAADDGLVKLWSAETYSYAVAHNAHAEAKETVAGAAFLDERDIVSVGSLGVLVLWNSRQNSVKVDSKLLKSYKPICLSACPHRKHAVALGTKQGVVLVVSVEDSFKILFKVHGHETEVTSVCWCPSPRCEPLEKQLAMKRPKIKSLKLRKVANKKTEVTLKNGQPNEVVEDDKAFLNTSEYGLYEQSSGEEADESDIFDVYKENSYKEFGYNPHSDSEKDNANTKYTPSMLLRKNIQYQKLDKSGATLTQAMESIKIKDEDSSKDSAHNSKFLDECKKLQDLMNSRKAIKSQGSNSFLIDDSFNDSVAEVVPVEPDSADVSINPADESDIFDIYKEPSFYEFGHSKYVPSQSDDEDDREKPKVVPAPCNIETVGKKAQSVDFLDACKKLQDILESKKQILPGRSQDEDVAKKESDKESDKNLHRSTDEANTDDDFLDHSLRNESTVNVADESDIFDIYKEPSFYEFGHSKYIPSQSDNEADNEKPRVKVSSDFLLECAKLKEMVAGKSDENSSENEISELSNNVKKLELETPSDVGVSLATKLEECFETEGDTKTGESSIFLATCCKKGKVCIWRWGGGVVCSGTIMMADKAKEEKQKKMGHPWGALSWPSSRVLLCCSKSSQLLRCNFHACYSRSKTFGFTILHEEHNRGLFAIGASATDSTDEDWRNPIASPTIWTAGQDRMLVGYSADESKVVANYTTFGGNVSDIAVSHLAPSRFAIAAGDGMVRVWERVENGVASGMRHYWNGVQGRVQAVAWHPTREHCLAFSNSEGRVGLLDASAMSPAKVLPPGLSLGVYNICWGPRNVLFANGGGELVVYNTSHINRDPEKLTVMSNGRKWGVSTVVWTEDFLTVGSSDGQLGLLKPDYPYDMVASGVPHRKSIQCIAWHPLAVSSEDGLSPYYDLIAVSSTSPTIVIMKMTKDEADGTVKLESYEEFSHHRFRVNKLCWSPHHNGKLLSVSHDHAVQVVDVLNKCVSHTLLGHADPVLCCVWCPVNPLSVISAGEDFTLRVWDLTNHPPQDVPDHRKLKLKRKMNLALVEGHAVKSKELGSDDTTPQSLLSVSEEQCPKKYESSEQLATLQKVPKKKSSRNQSPLAMLWKQYKDISDPGEGCRRLFRQYVARKSQADAENAVELDYSNGYDYLKIYGGYNDVMELLDLEQCKHEENLNWDLWAVLGLLRGDAKNVLEKAKEKKKICSSLLSVAPSVSHRFWKEMTAAYAEQLENAEDVKANDLEWRMVSWRAVLLLCNGELETACSHLCDVGLTADAVAVATLRHADHIVQKCLRLWAKDNANINKFGRAAECYIVLDEIMEAATVLGRSNNEENLALAAEMAKYAASQTNNAN